MDALGPFTWHKVIDLKNSKDAGNQKVDDCPFCGKEEHFFVNKDTGQWDCKSCGKQGNITTFLEEIHAHYLEHTRPEHRRSLGAHRKIPGFAFKPFGFAWDNRRWLIPIYNTNSRMQDIRTWIPGRDVRSTKGCISGLFGMPLLLKREYLNHRVWICEGEWDAVALNYVFDKLGFDEFAVGTPGAGTFKAGWVALFNDRNVVLAYDCDKAGDEAMWKVGFGRYAKGSSARKPGLLESNAKTLEYVRWPELTKEGTDVRDIVTSNSPKEAYRILLQMLDKRPRILPKSDEVPTSRLKDRKIQRDDPPDSEDDSSQADPRTFRFSFGNPGFGGRPTFKDVLRVYQEHADITKNMVIGLRAVFATVLSTQMAGPPLWMHIVGPSGSGKTLLLDSVKNNDQCVCRSRITPNTLVSGMKVVPDPSLIPKLWNKTFVLKDFTEILDMHIQDQKKIFSCLRGAHDGRAEWEFANGVMRNYSTHFSMLTGVTQIIHKLNNTSVGERFLKFQLLPFDHADQHDNAIRMAMENPYMIESIEDGRCQIVNDFLDVEIPNEEEINERISKTFRNRILALAKLVARIRSTVDRDPFTGSVNYRPMAEIGTRLAGALFKLAKALIIVDCVTSFGEEQYKVVQRIAFDTAIGWHLDIVHAIMENAAERPISTAEVVQFAKLPTTNVQQKLADMEYLRIIRRRERRHRHTREHRFLYRLHPEIIRLYQECHVKDTEYVERAIYARRRRKKERD